jgi:hypothetical protein
MKYNRPKRTEMVDPTWDKERMECELTERFLKDKKTPVHMITTEVGGRELPYILNAGLTYELVDLEPGPPKKKMRKQTPSLELTRQVPLAVESWSGYEQVLEQLKWKFHVMIGEIPVLEMYDDGGRKQTECKIDPKWRYVLKTY